MSFRLGRKRLVFWMCTAAYTFIIVQLAAPAFAQVPIPEGPAGKTLQAFLEAFNRADRSKIEAYVKTYDSNPSVNTQNRPAMIT